MNFPPHCVVIDPAIKKAEVDCFNHLVSLSSLPLTYHLPGIQGTKTLERETNHAHQIRGFLILGSESSVNDRHPWQKDLEAWLMPHLQKGIPTLGFCYGHQMLAHMFGGKVAYRLPTKEKLVGFRELSLNADPLWGESQKGKLYARHNEIVSESPLSMKVIATSAESKIDGLKHEILPIWTFQPHPEATSDFTGEPGAFNFGYFLIQRFLEFCSRTR